MIGYNKPYTRKMRNEKTPDEMMRVSALPNSVSEKLSELANYKHGWDGDDGEVIEEEALEIGELVLAYLHRKKLPMPEIHGAPSGAVDFSWPTLGVIATIYGLVLLIPKIPKEFDKGGSFELDEEPNKAAITVCNLIIPALSLKK